jgi:hypothetical protein
MLFCSLFFDTANTGASLCIVSSLIEIFISCSIQRAQLSIFLTGPVFVIDHFFIPQHQLQTLRRIRGISLAAKAPSFIGDVMKLSY